MTGSRTRHRLGPTVLLVMALLVSACGETGETTATTGGEDTTTPTGGEAGDTTTTEPMEDDGLPEGDLNLKVGHPATISIYDVIPVMTNERLNAQGWNVEDVIFARTGLNPQALAQNSVQMSIIIGVESLRTFEAGGESPKIKFVMDNNAGEFALVALSEFPTCEDFDGIRFGIHGETSSSSVAAVNFVRDECGAEPEILVVPGGENRIIALENGELDASLVQLGDWFELEKISDPGEYVLVDSRGALDFNGANWWVNTDWYDANPEVAVAYTGEILRTCQMVREDPTILEDAVKEHVEMSDDIVPAAVEVYLFGPVSMCPEGGLIDGLLEGIVDYNVAQGEIGELSIDALKHETLLQDALEYLEQNP